MNGISILDYFIITNNFNNYNININKNVIISDHYPVDINLYYTMNQNAYNKKLFISPIKITLKYKNNDEKMQQAGNIISNYFEKYNIIENIINDINLITNNNREKSIIFYESIYYIFNSILLKHDFIHFNYLKKEDNNYYYNDPYYEELNIIMNNIKNSIKLHNKELINKYQNILYDKINQIQKNKIINCLDKISKSYINKKDNKRLFWKLINNIKGYINQPIQMNNKYYYDINKKKELTNNYLDILYGSNKEKNQYQNEYESNLIKLLINHKNKNIINENLDKHIIIKCIKKKSNSTSIGLTIENVTLLKKIININPNIIYDINNYIYKLKYIPPLLNISKLNFIPKKFNSYTLDKHRTIKISHYLQNNIDYNINYKLDIITNKKIYNYQFGSKGCDFMNYILITILNFFICTKINLFIGLTDIKKAFDAINPWLALNELIKLDKNHLFYNDICFLINSFNNNYITTFIDGYSSNIKKVFIGTSQGRPSSINTYYYGINPVINYLQYYKKEIGIKIKLKLNKNECNILKTEIDYKNIPNENNKEIYFNLLNKKNNTIYCNNISYVDDINFITNIKEELQWLFNKTYKELKKIGIELSLSKCGWFYLCFNKNKEIEEDIIIHDNNHGIKLLQNGDIKILGIYYGTTKKKNNITWKYHTNYIIKKINNIITSLKQKGFHLRLNDLIWKQSIFKPIILSNILYGSCVIYPTKTATNNLDIIQLKFIKSICNIPRNTNSLLIRILFDIIPIEIHFNLNHLKLHLNIIMIKKKTFDITYIYYLINKKLYEHFKNSNKNNNKLYNNNNHYHKIKLIINQYNLIIHKNEVNSKKKIKKYINKIKNEITMKLFDEYKKELIQKDYIISYLKTFKNAKYFNNNILFEIQDFLNQVKNKEILFKLILNNIKYNKKKINILLIKHNFNINQQILTQIIKKEDELIKILKNEMKNKKLTFF